MRAGKRDGVGAARAFGDEAGEKLGGDRFIAGRKILGGTLWDRILGVTRLQPY
jgi:hypothetical protein